jgi:hypothetical protein
VIAGSVVTETVVRETKATPAAETAEHDPEHEASEHENTGYDETSGIVYEVQSHGFEILPQAGHPEEAPHPEEPEEAGHPEEVPPAEDTGSGHATAADTDDASGQPAAGQAAGVAGTVWNQTMATSPEPVEEAGESPGGAFGRIFGRRRDNPDDDRGGAAPLTRVRDLPFDQKMRIWRLRAMIVVVVGVVFSVIANWEIGITLAIIAGIADTIYRSRTAESHAGQQAGTIDRVTWRAQKRTIRQVSAMARAGYVAIHRRPIPNSAEVIDHLVIGPTGVYAIDSEKWDKNLPIRTRNGRQLWLGPESKKERLEHARWEAGQASERLSAKVGKEIVVQPTLAIYGPKIPWDIAVIRGVDVFSGERLGKYLHRRARRKDVPHLSASQIAEIHKAAIEVLPLEWQEAVTPVG